MPTETLLAPVCARCSEPIASQQGVGRRRKYCLACGPRKRQLEQVQLRFPEFCVEEGCGCLVESRGLCKKHYAHWYRTQNLDQSRAYTRDYVNRWRQSNPKSWKAIRQRTYAKNRPAHIARSVARKRGLRMSSKDTLDYREILKADPCSYCGMATTEIDHIVAVARDGSNEWPNLTGACRTCNSQKGERSLLEFLCLRTA